MVVMIITNTPFKEQVIIVGKEMVLAEQCKPYVRKGCSSFPYILHKAFNTCAYQKVFLFALCSQLFINCVSNNNEIERIDLIELASAFKQKEDVHVDLSYLIEEEIEYVKLKTPDSLIINENYLQIYVDENDIILIGFRQIYLFERKGGNFIREISCFGKGPGEYSFTAHNNSYDYSRKLILAGQWDWKKYFEYNLDGQVISNLDFTCLHLGSFSDHIVHAIDDVYVAFYNNWPNNNQLRLNLVDNDCNILKTYYHFTIIKEEPKSIVSGLSIFYKFQNELMFYEKFCDTIYHVSRNCLSARFVIDMGKYALPYEKQFDPDFFMGGESSRYFYIKNLQESKNYIFITFSHDNYWFWQAVYDKKTKK
ncbi:MAG: 6-bladed beta-propeller, partial [Cytophagales bacterium]|nr:6-bladed beta-propeller [Cytophagales bacterium]